MPAGTRLLRIVRHAAHWQLWTATKDFVHGSYLELHDDGRIINTTEREGDGPETFIVKGPDVFVASGGK